MDRRKEKSKLAGKQADKDQVGRQSKQKWTETGKTRQDKQASKQASRQAICSDVYQEFSVVPTFILRAVYSTKKEKSFNPTRLRPPLRGVGG